MTLQDWQRCCENIKRYVDEAGKAKYGTIQGNMVNVDGRLYTYKIAVPINVFEGSKVYVHIDNNVATIIGA